MRQSEFKTRYDPELGRFTRQHIYGEGVMDVFKKILVRKLLAKHLKKPQKQLPQKLLQQQPQKLVNMLEEKLVIK